MNQALAAIGQDNRPGQPLPPTSRDPKGFLGSADTVDNG